MNKSLEISKAVHDTLLPVLTEEFGDKVTVALAPEPDEGRIVYEVEIEEYPTLIEATPISSQTAGIEAQVLLGRLYVGYRRGLHWLACNRAGNTVALNASPDHQERRELGVYTHRITRPGDADGIRDLLADLRIELQRLDAILPACLPHLASGGVLRQMQRQAEDEQADGLRAILANPRGFLDWATENLTNATQASAWLVLRVAGWLRRYDLEAEYLEKSWDALTDEERDEQRVAYLSRKATNCIWRGQPETALELADQILAVPEAGDTPALRTLRAAALNALGRPEDMLDELREATLDANPRVWFWRAIAHARSGDRVQALDCFQRYEAMVGPDMFGRKRLREALPRDGGADAE